MLLDRDLQWYNIYVLALHVGDFFKKDIWLKKPTILRHHQTTLTATEQPSNFRVVD